MTKRQAAKKFLREWVEILQLHDYVIKMRLHDKLNPDMQSQTNGSHKTMLIDISLAQSIANIEWSIAHELSHIILDPTFRAFYGHVANYGKKSFGNVMESYNLSENTVIEHYLRIIYKAHSKTYPPHRGGADITVGDKINAE